MARPPAAVLPAGEQPTRLFRRSSQSRGRHRREKGNQG